MADDIPVRKGAKTKILGMVVIFLAALDSMLSWRGGEQPNEFYYLLFVAGGFLFALGAIRGLGTKPPVEFDNQDTPRRARGREETS